MAEAKTDNGRDYRNEPGLAKWLWDRFDAASGKGATKTGTVVKKAGSATTVIGVFILLIDGLWDGGLSWLGLGAGAIATLSGLLMRFVPKGQATEADMDAVINEVREMDFEKMSEEKQSLISQEVGLSVHEVANAINLLKASAMEVAQKMGDEVATAYGRIKADLKKGVKLGKKDAMLNKVLEYAGALQIKETVKEVEAAAS